MNMKHKEIIKKLRDNAELAWASYGYYDLIGKTIKKDNEVVKDAITPTDILDNTYNKYIAVKPNPHKQDDEIQVGTLKGDFSPNQAKRFFERYDLLIHQSNTSSGFSATLFGEKRKQKNIESKEISYTAEYGYINYILAFRGTEFSNMGDIGADIKLIVASIPKNQYFDMILFYLQCKGDMPFHIDIESKEFVESKNTTKYKIYKTIYNNQKEHKPYINPKLLKDSTQEATLENFISPITSNTKLNITGHSLGGCLAQLFTLSFARYDKGERGIINEVYTYNSLYRNIANYNIKSHLLESKRVA